MELYNEQAASTVAISAFFRDAIDVAPEARFTSRSHRFDSVTDLVKTLEHSDRGTIILRFDGDEEFLAFDEYMTELRNKTQKEVELVGGQAVIWATAQFWVDGPGWRSLIVRRPVLSQLVMMRLQAEAQAAAAAMSRGGNGGKLLIR